MKQTFPKPLTYAEREAKRLSWISIQTDILLAFANTDSIRSACLLLSPTHLHNV